MLRHNHHYRFALTISLLSIIIVGGFIVYTSLNHSTVEVSHVENEIVENQTRTTNTSAETINDTEIDTQPEVEPPEQEWPKVYSVEEASSLTVVVNKKHRLPEDYSPDVINFKGGSLREEAASQAQKLFDGARSQGLQAKLVSGYRSYNQQQMVYTNYVAQDGQELADTYSARPGHSEHQTGLAFDIGNANGECELMTCFGSSELGVWVSIHAHEYGFVVRYPEGKEQITGYQYEPWHLRYVGTGIATEIFQSKNTLDEYFGIVAGSY